MAAITNYLTLVQNIKDLAEDDSTEFAAYIDTAIDLAEERLIRECDFPELFESLFGTFTIGIPTVSLPTGTDYVSFFNITLANGDKKMLKRKTDDWLIDYWPDISDRDEPRYYSYEGNTLNLTVVPAPDLAYTFQIKFIKAPAKLSTSNATNYFIDNLHDVLFYACMSEIVKFQKAWSQVDIWEPLYSNARDTWNLQAGRQRRDDGNTPLNPEGGQNTIKHSINSNS